MRVLADTSAWSLLLRRGTAGHLLAPAAQALREYLEGDAAVFLTGIVYQEVLQGFRSEPRRQELVRKLEPFELLQPSRATHQRAARLMDRCLRRGVIVSTVDVLIAQVALERGCVLVTADADFHAIARCVRLKVVPEAS
ncbi:MAG: PIN domain nuclease [Myxococcales bacterium]|nr:PIN domain nuclease [Myxococcales bacterium]